MDINAFRRDIAGIEHSDDATQVRRKSRDMTTTFSPILRDELKGKLADLVVSPRDKDEVRRVAAAAARHRVPLLPRGAGTCNWGQGTPLQGGAILDMTALNRRISLDHATVRVEPGMIVQAVDDYAADQNRELRMHPSTRRTATLGGFLGGGHVGVGSCTWGILRDLGNVVGVEVISVEEEPRVMELRGAEVNRVHHAYGTNGIITEIEMPLAPAYRWREAIVDFKDFMKAVRFGVTLNASDGLVVKMVAINEWRYARLFTALKPHLRDERHTVHVMVADDFGEAFESLVADHGGTIVYQGLEGQGDFKRPLYEFSFGHARLHATRTDPSLVANIGIFPDHNLFAAIERVHHKFFDLGPLRLDMKRMDGRLTAQGSPLFQYRDEAHMASVIEGMQEEGVEAANTHTMHVKENGMKPIDATEIAFKRSMDPFNLMNPGKFAAEELAAPGKGVALPASGWRYQKA